MFMLLYANRSLQYGFVICFCADYG